MFIWAFCSATWTMGATFLFATDRPIFGTAYALVAGLFFGLAIFED